MHDAAKMMHDAGDTTMVLLWYHIDDAGDTTMVLLWYHIDDAGDTTMVLLGYHIDDADDTTMALLGYHIDVVATVGYHIRVNSKPRSGVGMLVGIGRTIRWGAT